MKVVEGLVKGSVAGMFIMHCYPVQENALLFTGYQVVES